MSRILPVGLLSAGLLVAACGDRAEPNADSSVPVPAPPVVEIVGNDYAFLAPDTLPSGMVTIRFRNDGQELHHVALYRLEQGRSLTDLMQAFQTGEHPSWAVAVGGPNSPAPLGGVSEGTVVLDPGSYALLCVIPSPDGVPHVAKGMAKTVSVVRTEQHVAAPEPDLTVTLTDYAFAFSAPPTAGSHLLKVEVNGGQAHEIVIVRLEPGKTAMDVVAWIEHPQGPPPGMPIGGTTGIEPGYFNLIPVVFEPGEYGLLCFLPDRTDGRPHLAHGMVSQFTVS